MTDKLLTTAQVAERLGAPERTIRDRAKRYGLGTLATPRLRLFTEADVARLRPHITGRRGRPKRTV